MKSFSDNIMDSQSNFDDSDYYPPWESTNDETEVPYSTRFKSCEEVLASFAASSKDKITERRYFVSERWLAGYDVHYLLVEDGPKCRDCGGGWRLAPLAHASALLASEGTILARRRGRRWRVTAAAAQCSRF